MGLVFLVSPSVASSESWSSEDPGGDGSNDGVVSWAGQALDYVSITLRTSEDGTRRLGAGRDETS